MGRAIFAGLDGCNGRFLVMGGEIARAKDEYQNDAGVYDQIDMLDQSTGNWTEFGKMPRGKHGIYPVRL